METEEPHKKNYLEIALLIAIIVFLFSLFVQPVKLFFIKSKRNATVISLGEMRSSLSVYYSELQHYPTDDLTSLTAGGRFLQAIPWLKCDDQRPASNVVKTEPTPSDSGQWSYDSDPLSPSWGSLHIGCFNKDSSGNVWSTY